MSHIRDVVQGWSVRAEAIIVLIGAFGLTLLTTLLYLTDEVPTAAITESALHSLIVYESVTLLALGGFLHLRGWTFQRIGLKPTWPDPLVAVGLAAGTYLVYEGLWWLASAAFLKPTYLHGASSIVEGHLALPTVIAVAIINGVFEEVFVCGYLITIAKDADRLAVGVNASVALRLAYHLYQGGAGVISAVPIGLIFAVWFSRTGRLWPLVIAHTIMDIAGLWSFVK